MWKGVWNCPWGRFLLFFTDWLTNTGSFALRLTTKGRFAVTAMLDIALCQEKVCPVTLAEVSARQGISLSYLEQLFGKLRLRGLVESVRGPGGGYLLAKATSEITVADIVLAVDESVDATQCGGHRNCHGEHACITHDLWEDLNKAIFGFMSGVTLFQLIENERLKQKKRGCSTEKIMIAPLFNQQTGALSSSFNHG